MAVQISEIINAVKNRRGEAQELLQQVVNINSFSYNKLGTDRVSEIFRSRFQDLGFVAGVVPRDEVGDILLMSNRAAVESGGMGGVLFNSHLDTVFEPEAAAIPFKEDEGILRGHGVTDDKGGAVIIYQAVRALKDLSILDSFPVRVLFNTDEEQGSYHSKELITQEAARSELVIVGEYGKPRPEGATVVTQRSGRGRVKLTLEGPRSEAALLEIMEKSYYLGSMDEARTIRIRDLEKENGRRSASIAFGFPTMAEGEKMQGEILEIIKRAVKEYKLKETTSAGIHRPPLIFTDRRWKMFEEVKRLGGEFGFKISPESRTSCSDASFVPDEVPVLDGMGPIGDNVHTEEEFMLEKSLEIRPAIMAGLVLSALS